MIKMAQQVYVKGIRELDGKGEYAVPSDNFRKNRIEYLVVMDGSRQFCTCNDYKYHKEENGEICKHMWRVVSEMVKKEVEWR